MMAMRLHRTGEPLRPDDVPVPSPGKDQVLLRVVACGVCRTDLHIVDGELPPHRLPLIPGHEIVGEVIDLGGGVDRFRRGQRVGVPWLGGTCGTCSYCLGGRENLCLRPTFTGYDVDGGYAEFVVSRADFCIPLPAHMDGPAAAPLLCAGLIGFRSYRRAGSAARLGLIGFGAAAHIIAQIAVADGKQVFAFTRPGDVDSQQFARQLGASWAGSSTDQPPEDLDAAIIFAPSGPLVVRALELVRPGGRVVCAGIHMSDIPGFPYFKLWGEREIVSIANLTRDDGRGFFERVEGVELHTAIRQYPLEQANEALDDLRAGRFQGAAVLVHHPA